MKTSSYFRTFTLLLIIWFTAPVTGITAPNHNIDDFISPDTCGGCHQEIFSQWENSMHNLSQKDPVYLSISEYLLKGLKDKDEIKEAESCVKCHVPVGVETGFPEKLSDDRGKIPEIANQGIQCDYCHSVSGLKKSYNNGILLKPGRGEDDPGVKRGPYEDSESDFHESEFSQLHKDSRFCGTCHNVKHVVYKTDLETTYQEWEESPYNTPDIKTRVSCQDCHMRQKPGVPATGSTVRPDNRGSAVDDGPVRKHVATHYFIGANSYVPARFKDVEKSAMADERLRNCAELTIDSSELSRSRLVIGIKNTGAGHYLPTGLTDVRQMWLKISIRDDKGNLMLLSGQPDKNGYLKDSTIIFNTIFGDGKGQAVANIAKAKEILRDKRVPPMQTLKETIELPPYSGKYLDVKVALLYRSASQRLVDLSAGKGKIKLPISTLAHIERRIIK